jgi:hypothetical protein
MSSLRSHHLLSLFAGVASLILGSACPEQLGIWWTVALMLAMLLPCYGAMVLTMDITYSTESARRDDEDLGQKFQHQWQTFVSNLTQKFIPYDLRFT